MGLRWWFRKPRVLVVNPSAEEALGIPATTLRGLGAQVDEVTTEEIAKLLVSGPPSSSTKILASFPSSSDGYDFLIILGSPLGVLTQPPESADDVQTPPRSLAEMEGLVRAFHVAEKPVLGLCLGSQIIARAFGGAVRKLPKDQAHTALPVPVEDDGKPRLGCEFGWHQLDFLPAAETDPVLGPALNAWRSSGGVRFPHFMQWHSDTFSIPKGAVEMARRISCLSQAFKVGRATYAFQCHIEVGHELSDQWCQDYVTGNDSFCTKEEWEPVEPASAVQAMQAKFAEVVSNGIAKQAEAFTHTVILKLLDQAPTTRDDVRRLVAFGAVGVVLVSAVVTACRRHRAKIL